MLALVATADTAGAVTPGLPHVSSGHRPGPDALYAAAPRAPQLENVAPWTAEPILVSSAIAYRDGEWLYQDFLNDDRGAAGVPDPSDPHDIGGFLFSPKAGTLTYPTDPVYANNAADLVELRVRALADSVAFRVTLNTLKDPERTAFTISLGTGDATSPLPHGAGVTTQASHFLTVHGTTADLRQADGDRVITPEPTAKVDLARRQIEVRVPTAALDFADQKWMVGIGVGLWDGATGEYLAPAVGSATATTPGGGSPTGSRLFNVGPRVDEPFPDVTQYGAGVTIADAAAGGMVDAAWWREKNQSQALAAGDISRFRQEVDFAKLRAGSDDDALVPKTGPMNRILASAHAVGQGLDYTKVCFDLPTQFAAGAACEGRMLGQLQPYALYVPKKPRPMKGWGLTLLLHSLSANYNQYADSKNQSQVGERAQGSLVATPAGRGPDGFYAGIPEADTFEVWADVARHYGLDPGFSAVTGYSMGGFGTLRLLARWPDLFSRGWAVVGAPGSIADQLPSLRNTPLMTWNAAADELVNIDTSETMVTDLTNANVRFEHLLFPGADHLSLATNDEYGLGAAFLGDHRVDRDPAHVTYVVDPREDSAKVGAVADHAYWLSGLRVRDTKAAPIAMIDVRSAAFGAGDPEVLPIASGAGTLDGGARGPMPFASRTRAFGPTASTAKADTLVVKATNVAAATVDARRAKVSCSPGIELVSDGPLDLRVACAPSPRCSVRRLFVITLPRLRGAQAARDRYTRVTVRVPGRRDRTSRLRSGRRSARVDLRGHASGRVRVLVSGRTARGRTVRVSKTLSLC